MAPDFPQPPTLGEVAAHLVDLLLDRKGRSWDEAKEEAKRKYGLFTDNAFETKLRPFVEDQVLRFRQMLRGSPSSFNPKLLVRALQGKTFNYPQYIALEFLKRRFPGEEQESTIIVSYVYSRDEIPQEK